jgi:hypothetical protein
MESTEISSVCTNSLGNTIGAPKTASAGERPMSSLGCARSPRSTVQRYSVQYKGYNLVEVTTEEGGATIGTTALVY